MSGHSVSRRAVMVAAATAVGGCTLTRHVGLTEEVTKAEANYQDEPNEAERCLGCRYFSEPTECSQVEGPVCSDGWCKYWAGEIF